MCLSVEVNDPSCVLAKGEHAGHQWVVVHNGIGYRCGYVRVDKGHPWHGRGYSEVDQGIDVHGGLTFAREDVACDQGKPDDGWWFGFDCAHAGDARDMDLPLEDHARAVFAGLDKLRPAFDSHETIKSTPYVVDECKSLCEQAKRAGNWKSRLRAWWQR